MRHYLVLMALMGILGGCQSSPLEQQERQQEEAQKAESDFEKGVDRTPTPQTLYAMARVLSAQRREEESQALLVRIIKLHPDFMAAYNDLAELQMRHRRLDESIRTLQEALQRSPRDAVLHNNLGICHLLKGQYPAAMLAFTAAAGIAPNETRYRANLANVLGLQGRSREALAIYQQIGPATQAADNVAILEEARKNAGRK